MILGVRFLSRGIKKLEQKFKKKKKTDYFSEDDANLILSTRIPLVPVQDRVAWTKTTNGQYNVKTDYQRVKSQSSH